MTNGLVKRVVGLVWKRDRDVWLPPPGRQVITPGIGFQEETRESGRGQPQSKTLREVWGGMVGPRGFGLRQPSGALETGDEDERGGLGIGVGWGKLSESGRGQPQSKSLREEWDWIRDPPSVLRRIVRLRFQQLR